MSSPYQNWIITERDPLITITLNRPQAFNSLTADTLNELRDIAIYIKSKPNIWVVVLEGMGNNFSAGVDVGLIKPLMNLNPSFFQPELQNLQLCIDEFDTIPQPKIAKIKGYCIGGGLILATCCDFRVASEEAKFALPEVKMGIAVIMGTQRITRLAGIAHTKEMILLGEMFDARQAQKYGLLNQIVAQTDLDEVVHQLVQKFYNLPPRTIAIAKQIIDEGINLDLRTSQDLEIKLQAELLGSSDWLEAVKSHFEKRPPKFNNQ
ncbi:MAG: enoyl-CoA hydratase/isomerase family protein [Microscillaceae bacterium]|nr:enoyl-CoA hydratase/isomerase family protein [Microscillaceae bacterium]